MTPAEVLAKRFHEEYEDAAPRYGYRTRAASAKPWAEVPEANRRLMEHVAALMLIEITVAAATVFSTEVDGMGTLEMQEFAEKIARVYSEEMQRASVPDAPEALGG